MSPDEAQIQAVLDGHAIAVKRDPTEAQMGAFFEGKAVRLEAEPFRSPPLPQKPNLAQSDHKSEMSTIRPEGRVPPTAGAFLLVAGKKGCSLRIPLKAISDSRRKAITIPVPNRSGVVEATLSLRRWQD